MVPPVGTVGTMGTVELEEALDAQSTRRSTVGLEEQAAEEDLAATSNVGSMSSLGQAVRDRVRSRLQRQQVSCGNGGGAFVCKWCVLGEWYVCICYVMLCHASSLHRWRLLLLLPLR